MILDRIVAAAQLHPGDRVLEIGPGTGLLTQRLLVPGIEVVAVEIDRDLCHKLRTRFASASHFHLIEGDFLALDLATALASAPNQPSQQGADCSGPDAIASDPAWPNPAWPDPAWPNKVVANIPYYITGPILEKLLGTIAQPSPNPYGTIVLLVQQEVAQRLCAQPGTKACGALTMRVQYLADCEIICPVTAKAFQPPPKVDSAVVRLTPHPPAIAAHSPPLLARLITLGFANKRKMLRNNLGNVLDREALLPLLAALGIPATARAESLTLANWVTLSNKILEEYPSLG